MKIKLYHILFRLFSYLADKTDGRSFFVKYKLLLGTLIISLTGISCNKPQQTALQKEATSADSGLVQSLRRKIIDSIKRDSIQKPIFIPPAIIPIESPPEYFITCYDPVVIREDTIKNEPKESPN